METVALQRKPLQFEGSGSEYFRIWIVNVLLSIITLGIYSAWAKVRRNRYLYSCTKLDGYSFDYHGDPMKIFKGRMIAFGFFFAINLFSSMFPRLGVLATLLIFFAMPWIIWRSYQFKMYNTSYRGIRFGFDGSAGGAVVTYVVRPFLVALSLGTAAPWSHQRNKLWQHGEARYGSQRFGFDATVGQFYKFYLLYVLGPVIALIVLVGYAVGVSANLNGGDPADAQRKFMLLFVSAYGLAFLYLPFAHAALQNMIWRHTHLGEHRLQCELKGGRLLWLGLTNVLGAIFTLGLFIPFAHIRTLRYTIESTSVLAAGELDAFVAAEEAQVSALGEGMADALDYDFSL